MDSPFIADLVSQGRLPDWAVIIPKLRTFVCPVCRKQVRDEFTPMCTGPHPSLDEHDPTVMVSV